MNLYRLNYIIQYNILRYICYIYLCIYGNFVYAQTNDSLSILKVAKAQMQILCADSLAGRGYIQNGHLKAANFLMQTYKNMGLLPLQTTTQPYFQRYSFPLNVVSNATLTINNKKLAVGKDFIAHPNTQNGKIKDEIIDIGFGTPSELGNATIQNKIVLFHAGYPKEMKDATEKKNFGDEHARLINIKAQKPAAILIVQEKLTGSFASEMDSVLMLYVLEKSLPKKCKKASIEINASVINQTTQNVVAYIKGKTVPDSAIVLCAHYDHLGRLGKATFWGGNDNASGTAFLLSIAQYFAQNPPNYSLVFISFGAEETGLQGSMYYTAYPLFPLKSTKFVLNFDLMGNGQEGIMCVAGKDYVDLYQKAKTLNEQLKVTHIFSARANAPNSDHYPFTQKKIPALFFYTMGGPKHYHDIYDRPEGLELPVFFRFRQLIIRMVQGG